MMLPITMPGASRLTMSQRTAPRWWCARTLDRDVKMMVAMEVAIAIFTARSAETPRLARMMVMNGTISMPPPMPSRPARKPVPTPSTASSTISSGSRIMGVSEGLRRALHFDQNAGCSKREKIRVSASATGPSS